MFSISLSQRAENFDPKVTYRIFMPGDPDDASSDEASIVAEMGEIAPGEAVKHLGTNAEAMGLPKANRDFIRTNANLGFHGLEIKKPGSIKVRADIGDNRYRIGALSVLPAQK
jgi:hypothetical protein